jgi:hypothetical protein
MAFRLTPPSEANMRANEKTDPWPRNGWRFLMIDRVPLAIPGFGRYRALDETMKKERQFESPLLTAKQK